MSTSTRPSPPNDVPPVEPVPVRSRSWWARLLGQRFLFVSIVLHLLFGVGAAVVVVQRYTAARKLTFKAGPPSPNRATRAVEHKVQMAKKQSTATAPAMARRITTVGLTKVKLPAMPAMPTTVAAPTKMAGAGGAGIAASAGPLGAAAAAPGGGSNTTMFGLRETKGGALLGTFYDFKQDRAGKPTEMAIGSDEKESDFYSRQNKDYDKVVGNFIKGGMSEGSLSRYYQSPDPLYTTQIFIPTIKADEGPAAFKLAGKVQPRRWIVVYRARVTPPMSGRYSFVGWADDVLAVRFNGQLVLDGSLSDPTKQRPSKTYTEDGIRSPMFAGDPVEVKAGTSYPIEIVVGERPGGAFNAFLFLEQAGATYQKSKTGSPILPIFKLASGASPRGNAPHAAPDTPWSVWKAEPHTEALRSALDVFRKP